MPVISAALGARPKDCLGKEIRLRLIGQLNLIISENKQKIMFIKNKKCGFGGPRL